MTGRLLSLGALALVTAACGSESVGSGDPARKTVRVETVIRSTGPGASELRTSTILDYGNDRSSYDDPTTGCVTITIGPVTYAEVPDAVRLPGGKHWVRYDGSGFDSEAAFEETLKPRDTTLPDGTVVTESSGILIAFGGSGPEQFLDDASREELELVGEEEIRGERTSHYRGEVDVRRGARKELEAEGWKAANIELYLAQSPPNDEVQDVWLGEDGLVRRVVTTTRSPAGHPAFESVSTSDYLDYGLAARIDEPPAAEVTDGADWRGKALESDVAPSCLH